MLRTKHVDLLGGGEGALFHLGSLAWEALQARGD